MSWSKTIAIDGFVWGLVVGQNTHNPEEFAGILASYKTLSEITANAWKRSYMDSGNSGGFCCVYPHPTPWLICIFQDDDWEREKLTALHEFHHLADYLPQRAHGEAVSEANEEHRAAIMVTAYKKLLEGTHVSHSPVASPAPSTMTERQRFWFGFSACIMLFLFLVTMR